MRKVLRAFLHDNIFIPGGQGGDLGNVLPPSKKNLPDFTMHLLDNGQLLVEWGSDPNRTRFVVGAATVKGALLAPEEPKPSKAVKASSGGA